MHVCLVGNPGKCEDVKLDMPPDLNPMACLATGMAPMAAWSGEHGDRWHIERFECKSKTDEVRADE